MTLTDKFCGGCFRSDTIIKARGWKLQLLPEGKTFHDLNIVPGSLDEDSYEVLQGDDIPDARSLLCICSRCWSLLGKLLYIGRCTLCDWANDIFGQMNTSSSLHLQTHNRSVQAKVASYQP